MWREKGDDLRHNRKLMGRSEEVRQRTSETLKENYKNDPSIRLKISQAGKGKMKSVETREKMKEAMTNRMNTPEYWETLRKIIDGKKEGILFWKRR